MPDASIQTHGRILEQAGPALYRVSLPNGKIILAHLSKRLADESVAFATDDLLLLEFTPYDFDTARILGQSSKLTEPTDSKIALNGDDGMVEFD